MLFDSHCHLHDQKFDADRDEVLTRAHDSGVSAILTLGDTLKASRAAIQLAENEPSVYAAAGIHPCNANCWEDETEDELRQLLNHERVIVLGEIGLDYYWDKDPAVLEKQRQCFRRQLQIARETGYPVSIHCRESTEEVLSILKEEKGEEIGGVLHCFSGSLEQARRGVELGFYLGVGGTSTFKKSHDLREVIKAIGLEHIVIETDSPYLAPQPKRGKRNEPSYVAFVASIISEYLKIPYNEFAELTMANTLKAFKMKEAVG